jgi:hypothetical protein
MTFTGATGKETYKTPRTISASKESIWWNCYNYQKQVCKKFQVQVKLVLSNSMPLVNAAKVHQQVQILYQV